jgi:hypothetical protein
MDQYIWLIRIGALIAKKIIKVDRILIRNANKVQLPHSAHAKYLDPCRRPCSGKVLVCLATLVKFPKFAS